MTIGVLTLPAWSRQLSSGAAGGKWGNRRPYRAIDSSATFVGLGIGPPRRLRVIDFLELLIIVVRTHFGISIRFASFPIVWTKQHRDGKFVINHSIFAQYYTTCNCVFVSAADLYTTHMA